MKSFRNIVLALWMLLPNADQSLAQGTAFTYQGRLNEGVNAANGSYDLRFTLFSVSAGAGQVGNLLTNTATAVSNGLFNVTLDFGNQFPGASRWLEIGVRTNGNGTFTTLTPRQPLTPGPYALYAANAGAATTSASAASVVATGITGIIPIAQLPTAVLTNGAKGVNISGTFSGNGAGVTNVAIGSLNAPGLFAWPGNFVLASSPGVGSDPFSVVAADVNGDGKLDLISANYFANTLTVLTNNGSGGFGLASSPGVGSFPYSVVVADVNGDGKPDLISANYVANTLSVLTNNGSGSFVLAASPFAGSGPHAVVAADVTGDGKVDLICVNSSADTLTVLTNNGSGGFVLSSSPGTGSHPLSVVAADVNGDGKLDLISANYGANTVTVLTNNGGGGFVLASSPDVGSNPASIVAADVNGDGKVDLISADSGANTLTVLTNNGSGGFGIASSPAVGSNPVSVLAADLNGDGKLDLVSANHVANTLTVLFNTPTFTGQFSGNGSGLTALNPANLVGGNVGAAINFTNTANTFTGTFTGNGGGLTNVWQLGGNNVSAGQFLGTINNQAFEIRVNGQRAMLLTTNTSGILSGSGNNIASGTDHSLIGGGLGNYHDVNAFGSVIGGGQNNTNQSQWSGIFGGLNNLIVTGQQFTFIGGGEANSANGSHSTIGGGYGNSINGYESVIGGGSGNIIKSVDSIIGGGAANRIDIAADKSIIGGGEQNVVESEPGAGVPPDHSTSGGGYQNRASVNGSTVGGGVNNKATNVTATVPGGAFNVAGGRNSFAAGLRAKALHDGSFVWADGQNVDLNSTAINQFLLRAKGGVGINTSLTVEGSLCVNTNAYLFSHNLYLRGDTGSDHNHGLAYNGGTVTNFGTGNVQVDGPVLWGFAGGALGVMQGGQHAVLTWTNGGVSVNGGFAFSSDSALKTGFDSLNPQEILARVTRLPMSSWFYKMDIGARHVGPMAQDFYAAFQLGGDDDKHINIGDETGVALAAIQGLDSVVKEKDAKISALETRVGELERLVKQLAEKTAR